ncbi:MAG: HlyD family efflux transporter periplasmic adaptor subunit [Bacteroides sp.]|nr:HlyD family efflux transporter periplasmic adaptor subunit [Bacteroides sp.]
MDRELTKRERALIRRRRLLPIAVGGGVLLTGAVILFAMMKPAVKREELLMATADRGTIETSVTGAGSVVPAFEEIINSPISSRVVEIYCKPGDTVAAGTPLLRLDLQNTESDFNKQADQIEMKRYELEQQRINDDTRLKDLALRIKVKEMSVDRQAVELRNERYLDSLGSGTGDRVRQAQLAYDTGCLELSQLRQQLDNERRVADATMNVKRLDISIAEKNMLEKRRTLDDAQVCAPRSATVTYINDQIGQKVSEGERIAVISDLSRFKVDGELPDGYADRISVGSGAMVRIGQEKLPGRVSNITPLSRNGVISFSVSLDNASDPRLRSGLKVDVYIMNAIMDDVIRIPVPSVYSGAGVYRLFVATGDDRLELRDVTLGDANYDYVEVVSGLTTGEQVVISDMTSLYNNKSLKIK